MILPPALATATIVISLALLSFLLPVLLLLSLLAGLLLVVHVLHPLLELGSVLILLGPPLGFRVLANGRDLLQQIAGLLLLAAQHNGALLHVRRVPLGLHLDDLGLVGQRRGQGARHLERVEVASRPLDLAVLAVLVLGRGDALVPAHLARQPHAVPAADEVRHDVVVAVRLDGEPGAQEDNVAH